MRIKGGEEGSELGGNRHTTRSGERKEKGLERRKSGNIVGVQKICQTGINCYKR